MLQLNAICPLPQIKKACCFLLIAVAQQWHRIKCLLRSWVAVVVFTVDTSAVPQRWKNAVARATSDLYHMEASITVFLHRGRRSAVTWPLSANRISVLHRRLSCSTCSLSTGSVLHWRESMLRPGAGLGRRSRGAFLHVSTSIVRQC